MSVSVKSNSNGTAGSIQVNGTDVITFDSTGNLTATTLTGTISSQSLSSSGNLTFSTNSTERLRIGTSGEFGIGGANYGTSGQVLTSGGSGAAPSWSTIDALPSQTGNSGKYLTTNGTVSSWSTINAGATISDDTATNSSYYPTFVTTTTGNMTTAKVSSTKLYFNPSTGTLNATIFNSLSDVNQKDNISTIVNSVDIVNQLRGVEFTWKDNGKKSSGVIAQELETVLDHLVEQSQDGVKSVNYSGLIGYLIESVKELSARVVDLESK